MKLLHVLCTLFCGKWLHWSITPEDFQYSDSAWSHPISAFDGALNSHHAFIQSLFVCSFVHWLIHLFTSSSYRCFTTVAYLLIWCTCIQMACWPSCVPVGIYLVSPFCHVIRELVGSGLMLGTKPYTLRQGCDAWLQLNICLWLQIPKAWWVPAVADTARSQGNERREISMKEVLELQLGADAATVWLPKYLLVVYQLTM